MSRLSKHHFWEWFSRNNKEYLGLNAKTKKEANYWLNELNAHLRAYFKFFGYALALPENGIARLTVTVHGKAMHFNKVESFVATAPEIPDWNFMALEEPAPIDLCLEKEIKAAGIDPRECSFSFESDDPECTDIIVYHPLYTIEKLRLFLNLVYEAVYNVLGERSFGLDLGCLQIANLSEAVTEDIYPLEELPVHIGLRRSTIVVDNNGTLLGME